ncbi:MAG TPA: ABC transporter ATP-binding protein [Chroococcales cyanobacterium]
MDQHIQIRDANLKFRIYKNRAPALKEAVIKILTGKGESEPVTVHDALKNINLSLKSGDRLGVIGMNGAGKSTLLKMIVGIYPPHSGQVLVKGKITPLIELGTGFDYELSGRENIYLNGALLGRSYQQMRNLEKQIIEFSELEEFIDTPIKYYSSGMHGRLAFSIGTAMEPEILFVDEIFATGDGQFVQKAIARMQHLFSSSGITIFVSHNLDQIVKLCNRAIILHKGAVVRDGAPAEVVDYYVREITRNAATAKPAPEAEHDRQSSSAPHLVTTGGR